MYKLCGGTLLVILMHSSIKNTTETVLLSDISKILKPKIYIDNGTIKEQTKSSNCARNIQPLQHLLKILQ